MTKNPSDMRLNRFIADSGYCSRREADELIKQGHVTVDGLAASLGQRVNASHLVKVKGKVIHKKQAGDYIYLALNKPVGITCTTDRRRRDNIVDFLGLPDRIYPIGRLDRDSSGLILLTNDGSIVNKILRESNHKEKEYEVTVDKNINPAFLQQMSDGVPILGTVTKPCKVRQVTSRQFRIILTQGLNRQIRRMCEYCGYRVTDLNRLRIMNINLGNLASGHWRALSPKELRDLKALF